MSPRKRLCLTLSIVVLLAGAIGFAKLWVWLKAEVQAETCIKNLRQIGLAGCMVAATNRNVFPMDFAELAPWIDPHYLVCPTSKRKNPTERDSFDVSEVTYEMIGVGMSRATDYSNVFVRCPIHSFKVYGDGWAPPRGCKAQRKIE